MFYFFYSPREKLHEVGLSCTVGDEGDFAPHLSGIEQGLELLVDAIYLAGFDPGEGVCIALDCASSQFYSDGYYKIFKEFMNSDDFSSYLYNLCSCFQIVSIEDGMAEDDWSDWKFG